MSRTITPTLDRDFTNWPECEGPWIHGLHWHLLTYLGDTWGRGEAPRNSDEFLMEYTRRVVAAGGSDVRRPILPSGLIPEPFRMQLCAIGGAVAGMRAQGVEA